MTDRRRSTSTPPGRPNRDRPSGATGAALETEGIRWEGPVVLRGEADLRAHLVLTRSRVVLARDGEIALDVPESWLRPSPRLLGESGVRLFLTPDGARPGTDETDRLVLRVVEGRPAAERLVAVMGGVTAETRPATPTIPRWGDRRQAAPSVALPPLPEFGDEAPARRTWPPAEQHTLPSSRRASGAQPGTRAPSGDGPAGAVAPVPLPSISTWADQHLGTTSAAGAATASGTLTPARRTRGDDEDLAVPPPDEPHQFNRGLVWGLRLAILLIVATTGLYFGRDRLPANLDIPLPAAVQEQLGLNATEDVDDISQLGAGETGTGTEASGTGPGSDGTSGPPNGSAIQPDQTASDDAASGQPTGGEPTASEPGAVDPTSEPTVVPTVPPTAEPTIEPTVPPTAEPTIEPMSEPTTIGQSADENEQPTRIGGQAVPTEEPTVVPTEEPTAVPTEEPTTVPTEEPTAVPTEEPTAVPTEEPTAVPTEEPTAVPTEEPTAVPTEEPTAVPTEEPTAVPTEEPTAVPTEEPTAVPTEEPTAVPTEEAVATLESQPASVPPDTEPEQAVSDGTFRYTIQGAAIGETIPEVPEINAVGGYGEWVILSVYGENWSDSTEVFDMSAFRLYADGEEILLDVGNAWVSEMLGNTPAYGNTDAIQWAANEGHTFTLTFLAPPDAESLVLYVGDQTFDLSETLADPQPLTTTTGQEGLPEYIEADVVEVVDAETIVIEQDGIEQTVRYLGIDVPTGTDCYADEATALNAELVDGQTVRIERQVTDVDARGNWVRDVWVADEDGRFFLVAEQLVAEGAAIAGPSEPNTRFASWLRGSQSVAEAEALGLWGACDDSAARPSAPLAVLNSGSAPRTGRRAR